MWFSDEQLAYLKTQPLGRLATVDRGGQPQNNPVGFDLNTELQTIDIGGLHMGASKKFRNVKRGSRVGFVVDDLASTNPWRPRMVEIRGWAEALDNVDPPRPGMSREIIRVHPERIIAFGL
jgi:pyridoxamine 5'-phosphate oxidase family protein